MKYKLKDICVTVTDGSHYSPKAQDDGYPMFSVKDMLEYGFDYSKCKRISQEDFGKMKSSGCVPQIGDVLVAKDGSYLKEIFVCRETKDEAILSSIAIFRPKQNIINSYYLCYLLKSPQIFNYISMNCVSGSALPRIVLKAFKEVEMDVPDIELQKKVVKILKDIDDKIQVNNKINRNFAFMAA
jgi:type I restriction enzyme S subunit